MAQKVCKCSVRKEPGYLYFVDRDGDIAREKMFRRVAKKSKPKRKVKKRAKKKAKKRRR